jgi:hypothetical protein
VVVLGGHGPQRVNVIFEMISDEPQHGFNGSRHQAQQVDHPTLQLHWGSMMGRCVSYFEQNLDGKDPETHVWKLLHMSHSNTTSVT